MAAVPFVLNFDSNPFYDHHIFPNHMYRRQHNRQQDPLNMDTMGMIARLWPHSKHLLAKRNGELEPLNNKKKQGNFEIHLDVSLFQPDEISVKLSNDCVIIEGKHEEREDEHGHVSRHFMRRYNLPDGSNLEQIISTLSTDGILTVKVPQLNEEKKTERIIQIQQVGPSDLFLKNGNNTFKDTKSTLTDNNCKSDKGNNTDAH